MTRLPMPADDANGGLRERVRVRTAARLLEGRAGASYRTGTQLALRCDHAAAVDAVHEELDPSTAWGAEFLTRWGLFEVQSQATSKAEYLRRPDLGRRLSAPSEQRLQQECPRDVDLQVVVGDGLSARAAAVQVPRLLPLIAAGAQARNWRFGRPFVVRYCRVGIMNDIGRILAPRVVVLLVGERPGLATSESLSAYLAYRPREGHTDASRNLVANIHDRGASPESAARRIAALARKMCQEQTSGVSIKESDDA